MPARQKPSCHHNHRQQPRTTKRDEGTNLDLGVDRRPGPLEKPLTQPHAGLTLRPVKQRLEGRVPDPVSVPGLRETALFLLGEPSPLRGPSCSGSGSSLRLGTASVFVGVEDISRLEISK